MGFLKNIFSGGILGVVAGLVAGVFTGGLGWAAIAKGAMVGGSMGALSSVLVKKPQQPNFTSQLRDRKVTVRAATEPLRVIYGRTKVAGVLVFAESSGSKNEYMHLVLALAGHEVAEIGEVYFNHHKAMGANGALDSKWAKWALVKRRLGTASQAAIPELVNASSNWTSAHRGRGVAHLYARLKFDKEGNVWPTGLPNITAVVKGKKVWDPRSDAVAWSDNPALCALDYLRDSRYGLGASDEEIDLESFKSGADYCDAAPADKSGDSKRFGCNGSIAADIKPRDALEQLLSSCGGALTYSRGVFRFCIGPADAVATLGGDELRADIRVLPRPARRELFNTVGGAFSDKENGWVSQEFPEVAAQRYIDEDGGEKLVRNAELPFTTSLSEATRLAGVSLQTARQSAVIEFPANLSALELKVWDVVKLNIPQLGYDDKLFRVVSWQMADPGGIDLTLAEYSASAYEWSGEFPVADPAPDTVLPDPWRAPMPMNLRLQSGDDELEVAADGTIISKIRVMWDEPSKAQARHYEVEWKKSSSLRWQQEIAPYNQAVVGPIEAGAVYDLRVRMVNSFGSKSEWLEFASYKARGKSAPPPKPESFLVEQMADGTRKFSWALSPMPADVRAGGGFVIRYEQKGSKWANMRSLHEGVLTSSPYESNALAAGSYSFAIKSRDSSGNLSAEAVYIDAVLGNPRLKNVIYSSSQRAKGWPGVKVRCFVEPGGSLIASGRGNSPISGLPAEISQLPDRIYGLGGLRLLVFYYSDYIDLGADLTFTPLVSLRGKYIGVTVYVYYRKAGERNETNLLLDGAPSPITARHMRFHLWLRAGAEFMLEEMLILLDGEGKVVEFNDLNTATATKSEFERIGIGRFKVAAPGVSLITQARITALQNVGPGWSWVLMGKNKRLGDLPAAEFRIFNGDKAAADATVDVSLQGPKEAVNA